MHKNSENTATRKTANTMSGYKNYSEINNKNGDKELPFIVCCVPGTKYNALSTLQTASHLILITAYEAGIIISPSLQRL